jgi:hypothetical protein
MLCAWAVSAVSAAPALAGGVNTDSGQLSAALYNLTPYTFTQVAGGGGFAQGKAPAATIAPGESVPYSVAPNVANYPVLGNLYSTEFGYDAWITYRVDVLGGAPPEYVTFTVTQCYCTGIYGTHPAFETQLPTLVVWDTTAPPTNYDPGPNPAAPPATQTANPQITYEHNIPFTFDQTFQIKGNYTVDASTDLGAPFVNVLNTLCSGAANTTCSFTQEGPLTWGTGDVSSPFLATHCGVGSANFSVSYTAEHTATLSVGGGITLATQVTILDVESNSIAVSVDAQHDWTQTQAETRTSSMDLPAGDIGYLWVIPTVGKVVGTLVVSNGSATFTANNFTQVHDGVSRNQLTPKYDVVTKVRPMTPAELQNHCGGSVGSTLQAASGGKPPPLRLVPGRGVAGVSLGQTQKQVERELGPAKRQQFLVHPCQGLERGCDAVPGTGGRWTYRKLTVVFGHDTRVSGLIYRGAQRSARGGGVGASEPVVRGSHPQATCSRPARGRKHCTLIGTNGGHTVKTVFGFRRMRGGLYKCDRVLVYVLDGARERVAS